jgi:hypothetical protein
MDDSTMAATLPLPKRLLALVDSGLWPRTEDEERRQHLRSLVSVERVPAFAPEHDRIDLAIPPFRTIAERMRGAEGEFWVKWGALEEITPELLLMIAYFEHGSDASVALDHRHDRRNPSVIRLLWWKPQPNTWVRCSDNFDQFAHMVGLESAPLQG